MRSALVDSLLAERKGDEAGSELPCRLGDVDDLARSGVLGQVQLVLRVHLAAESDNSETRSQRKGEEADALSDEAASEPVHATLVGVLLDAELRRRERDQRT